MLVWGLATQVGGLLGKPSGKECHEPLPETGVEANDRRWEALHLQLRS